MSLRGRWRSDDRIRRGARGALAGASAGLVATFASGGIVERYALAFFVGAVVFAALWLIME